MIRSSITAITSIVLGLVLPGCGTPAAVEETNAPLATASALLIVGQTPLASGDAAFKARLEAKGLAVLVRRDSALCAGDVAGKALIAVSSTVTPGRLDVNLRGVAAPLLTWEPALFQSYGMVPNGGARGAQPSQTTLELVAPAGDPMAAGLTGSPPVVTSPRSFSWGRPGAAATVVARLPGDARAAAIFRYERGAAMFGLAAPERRAALFLGDDAAASLTVQGQALVDAAIVWSARLVVAPKPNGVTCSAASECASGFCAEGVCCASACTGPCLSCALAGTFGTCAAVPAGANDPRGRCADQGAASCATDGACDGAGACRLYAAGTTCAPASCPASSSVFRFASTCDGLGACVPGAQASCAPYTCNGANACLSACVVDAECTPGALCSQGVCLPL
jgi:hypothetical protein